MTGQDPQVKNWKVAITFVSGRTVNYTVAQVEKPEAPETGRFWRLGDIQINLNNVESVTVTEITDEAL
jgi:hypothetical protein